MSKGVTAMPQLLLDLAAGREPPSDASPSSRTVDLAIEHRLGEQLRRWLPEGSLDHDSETRLVMENLRFQAQRSQVVSVLSDISSLLAERNLDVALVKGLVTERRYYEHPGARPSVDIDLLIAPRCMSRVGELVATVQPRHPWAELADTLVRARAVQSITMRHRHIEVDLHLDLLKLGTWTKDAPSFWARTQTVDVAPSLPVRALDPTSELLLLIIHLNKDRFQRLGAYADIRRAVEGDLIDWHLFGRIIEQQGLDVPVSSALGAVQSDLGVDWDLPLHPVRGARARIWRLAWPGSIRLRGAEGRLRYRWRQSLLMFLARRRGLDSLRALAREVFPPRSAVAARYQHIAGPYAWKLLIGRLNLARWHRERLRALGHEPSPQRQRPRT